MSAQHIYVPDIGAFADIEVVEVLVKVGDKIAPEDPLIALESDKATMEIPSPSAGIVQTLHVNLGDKVSKGTLILVLEPEKVPIEVTTPEPTPSDTEPLIPEALPAPNPSPTSHIETERFKKAHATPSVRKFARELGADLGQIQGSGRKGRITEEDVKTHIKTTLIGTHPATSWTREAGVLPPRPRVDFAQFGAIERVKLTRTQQLSGEFLHSNWLNIPHVTHWDDADITELENFRHTLNQEAEANQSPAITVLAFIVKAVAAALKRHPRFNSSLGENDTLILKHYVHIGIAVETPEGLVVPVLRHVEQQSLSSLASEIKTLSHQAHARKLKPLDLQGGCFSVSNVGGIGGRYFTPLINAPEVAILGVGKAAIQPVWDGHAFMPRLMLPLSLSYDHRVIDGAEGTRFMLTLTQLLHDIRRLLV